MTDNETLDCIQENLTSVHESLSQTMAIKYYDEFSYIREVSGDNLRDCIRKATK